jgi:hypothetical protein
MSLHQGCRRHTLVIVPLKAFYVPVQMVRRLPAGDPVNVDLYVDFYISARIRVTLTTPGVTWDLDKTARHPTLVCCDYGGTANALL